MKKKSMIKRGLIMSVCLMIIPVICSVIYIYINVSSTLEKTATETVGYYTRQFQYDMEDTMDAMKNIFYYLSSNKALQASMAAKDNDFIQSKIEIESSIGDAVLYNSAWDEQGIQSIFLFKDEETYHSLLRGGLYTSTATRIRNVYNEYADYYSLKNLVRSSSNPGYCYFITDYRDINTIKKLGKIIIEVDLGSLINVDSITGIYPDAAVYISDFQGNVLYSIQPENRPKDFTACMKGREKVQDQFVAINGQQFYQSRLALTEYNIKIDVFIDKSDVYSTVNKTVMVYLGFSIIVLFAVFFAAIWGYRLLTKPLTKMVDTIDVFAGGNLTIRMPESNYRETDIIAVAFNHMADNLEELYDAVYEKGLRLKEAEYQMLQSQINPHFIFNVLETINMHCMETGQIDTCRIVANLAQLMRSNILLKNQQKITLQQEIQYAVYYLELQRIRFGDMFQYDISLEDDSLLQLYVPKLTIQPLVENSITHGLESKRVNGMIHIIIWEDEELYIKVSDNGTGFDIRKLDLNTASGKSENEKHNHVALFNINRRICLLYGDSYGLEIKSTQGKGTDVLVSLPRDDKGDA